MNSFLVSLGGISAGMIIFQSALNAPTIFKAFSENEAGPFLRLIFPKLFSCVFFVSVFGFSLSLFFASVLFQASFLFSALLMAICYLIVPATNRARDTGNDSAFKRLHTISVVLTIFTMLSNLSIVFF